MTEPGWFARVFKSFELAVHPSLEFGTAGPHTSASFALDVSHHIGLEMSCLPKIPASFELEIEPSMEFSVPAPAHFGLEVSPSMEFTCVEKNYKQFELDVSDYIDLSMSAKPKGHKTFELTINPSMQMQASLIEPLFEPFSDENVNLTNQPVPQYTSGCWVELIGAGGSGGPGQISNANQWCTGGYGGGGGAYIPRFFISADKLGQTYSVTRGLGVSNQAGGASIFSSGSITLTAGGGAAGRLPDNGVNTSGGAPTCTGISPIPIMYAGGEGSAQSNGFYGPYNNGKPSGGGGACGGTAYGNNANNYTLGIRAGANNNPASNPYGGDPHATGVGLNTNGNNGPNGNLNDPIVAARNRCGGGGSGGGPKTTTTNTAQFIGGQGGDFGGGAGGSGGARAGTTPARPRGGHGFVLIEWARQIGTRHFYSPLGGPTTFANTTDKANVDWNNGFTGTETLTRVGISGGTVMEIKANALSTFPGIVTPQYPISANKQIHITALIQCGTGVLNNNVGVLIRYFNSAGTWLTQVGNIQNCPHGMWTPVSLTETPPAGTAFVDYLICMGLAGDYNVGDMFYVDTINALMEG